MDFSNRSTQQTQSAHAGTPLGTSAPTSSKPSGREPKKRFDSKWWRLGAVVLLFCITILIAAVVALLAIGGPNEDKFVNTSKYQAVFLTNGQVYFGHIKDINSSYINLTNIYYLQSSSSNGSTASPNTASNNVTLIKLGCELHKPYDQMLINVSQVSFWENIQSDGQVGAGIAKLPKCTQSTGTTSQSNTNSTTDNSTTKP
jgi:hypothetical protein